MINEIDSILLKCIQNSAEKIFFRVGFFVLLLEAEFQTEPLVIFRKKS